jgi:micrococcal nuclease
MIKRLSCCVLMLWLWAGLVSCAGAETLRVRVASVLDGDTLVLESGERLRLRGIDAPELRHGNDPGQYYGVESKKALTRLAAGKDLFLDRSEMERDRYGRLLGTARMGNGQELNLLMVEAGAAFAYPHRADRDSGLAERILAAQREAIRQGRGFWPRILGASPAPGGYVGSKSSLRFHRPSCPNAGKIKRSNRISFSTLRQAFEAGYAPARECTPWPAR